MSTGLPSELTTYRDLPVIGLEKSSTDWALAGATQQNPAITETMARRIESTHEARGAALQHNTFSSRTDTIVGKGPMVR
jgi:hypothetical protein